MEPSITARLMEFTVAVFSHWWVWFTGGALVMEQFIELLSPTFRTRIESVFPKEKRRKLILMLGALIFVVASFEAFDDVNSRLRQEQARTFDPAGIRQQIEKLTANRWDPLSRGEAISLRTQCSGLEKLTVDILCNYAGCSDLAESFSDVFRELGWKESVEPGFGPTANGVAIASINPLAPRVAEIIERATAGRIKVKLEKLEPANSDEDREVKSHITLVLGRKPR